MSGGFRRCPSAHGLLRLSSLPFSSSFFLLFPFYSLCFFSFCFLPPCFFFLPSFFLSPLFLLLFLLSLDDSVGAAYYADDTDAGGARAPAGRRRGHGANRRLLARPLHVVQTQLYFLTLCVVVVSPAVLYPDRPL